ncbi:MAG: lamin tail domain-containing protein, partial [Candidatus Woesearchaeota archaeon]|nr:lamin tail domain-containing protein [Candidatus Woesearchaeota archaeon]
MKKHNLSRVLFLILVMVLFFPQAVSAEVLIHQVLYDPFQESGSEVVELINTGSAIVDISGWQIESDQFSPDATLPNGSRIEPAGFFLIADKNWSAQKDNPAWPDANYEETISLKNGIGGVALKDKNNSTIDSVG